MGVLAQFYFGESISPDPPHPPGRVWCSSIGNGGSGAVLFWSTSGSGAAGGSGAVVVFEHL